MNNLMPLDANGNPIYNSSFGLRTEKVITFIGGTPNATGDFDGTGDPFTIFTVTGIVVVKLIAKCLVDLVGAAALLPQVSNAEGIDVNELWHMTDGTVDKKIEPVTVLTDQIISSNIIGSIGSTNITAGSLQFVCFWYPLSSDGNVVAA
jgi:hypothetical protein